MSTILKALDRLDEEKAAESRERPLREEVSRRHSAPRSRGPSRRAFPIVAGVGIAVLAIGFTLVVSGALTGTPDEAHREVSPARLAGGLARAEQRAAAIQVAQGRVGEPVQPPQEEARVLPPSALASEVAVIEPSARAVPRETHTISSSATTSRTSVPTAPRKPESSSLAPATPGSITAPGSITVLTPPREAPASVSPPFEIPEPGAADTAGALPRVATAPLPAIPDLRVARTIWHPTADRRLAYVDVSGQAGPLRVREGDAVGHLIVQKIEPWGVVFLDDGIEIRHRVGVRN